MKCWSTTKATNQDDYGVHSAWIEIFNRSYGSADLAGCYLKFSSQPGDTASYFIPKGDVLTLINHVSMHFSGLMENQDAVHFIRTSNWMPQMPTGLGCMIPARNCLIKS